LAYVVGKTAHPGEERADSQPSTAIAWSRNWPRRGRSRASPIAQSAGPPISNRSWVPRCAPIQKVDTSVDASGGASNQPDVPSSRYVNSS